MYKNRVKNEIFFFEIPSLLKRKSRNGEIKCIFWIFPPLVLLNFHVCKIRVREFQKTLYYSYSLPYLYSTYFGFSSKENFQNFSTLKLALFVTSFTHKVTITQVFFTSHSVAGSSEGFNPGLFLDTFLTNQLNWSWRFLSFSEILLEFFQYLAWVFSQFSLSFSNFCFISKESWN